MQLKAASKTHTISSFKDAALATSLPVIDLVDAIKPGTIEYGLVKLSPITMI